MLILISSSRFTFIARYVFQAVALSDCQAVSGRMMRNVSWFLWMIFQLR